LPSDANLIIERKREFFMSSFTFFYLVKYDDFFAHFKVEQNLKYFKIISGIIQTSQNTNIYDLSVNSFFRDI
jgi:hypothetical protein